MKPVTTLSDGPGVVVMQWSPHSRGLVDALARTMARAGVARLTCVGEGIETLGPGPSTPDGRIEIRGLALERGLGLEQLVERLTNEVRIVDARAVIVLPRRELGKDAEPDSISRLTCAAIRRACGAEPGPNILVEVEDPEAAFEFVGLGVATVFYAGHLRAALLGQACVDLGVFQFIIGLLRGRHSVRTIEVPDSLRARTFADAALELELDEHGRPMTVIGIATGKGRADKGGGVLVNPGPGFPLREALGLLVLTSGVRASDVEPETEPEPEVEPEVEPDVEMGAPA